MKIKSISMRYEEFGTDYFFVVGLIFALCIGSTDVRNNVIDIPHIVLPFPPLYLVLLVTLLMCLVILKKQRIKIDVIGVFLIVRLALHLIPELYAENTNDFLVNFTISCLCLLVYIVGMNFNENRTKMFRVIRGIFILICFQTLLESYMGTISFWGDAYRYKNDLIIPMGGSNAIASKIIPCFAFLMCFDEIKKNKIFYITIVLFTILLTKSRGGLIVAIAALILSIAWNGTVSFKKIMQLLACTIVIGVVGLRIIKSSNLLGSTFSTSLSTVFKRIELWGNGMSSFLRHPLFGNGLSSVIAENNPHNFIIHIFMRSGICGILVFLLIIICFIKKIRRYTTDNYVRGCVCFAICMCAQGLVEIVLFSYIHDFMLWFVLGSMTSRIIELANIREKNID